LHDPFLIVRISFAESKLPWDCYFCGVWFTTREIYFVLVYYLRHRRVSGYATSTMSSRQANLTVFVRAGAVEVKSEMEDA
jgi:hypothetical protein